MRPASANEQLAPPQSGLGDILSMFQKIEDKYMTGTKDIDQSNMDESSMSQASPKKKSIDMFAQSTEDIYNVRMQNVIAKYSTAEMAAKKHAKLTKYVSTASKSNIPIHERLFKHKGSNTGISKKTTEIQSTSKSRIVSDHQKSHEKNKLSGITTHIGASSNTDVLKRKKGVSTINSSYSKPKISTAKKFANSFIPSHSISGAKKSTSNINEKAKQSSVCKLANLSKNSSSSILRTDSSARNEKTRIQPRPVGALAVTSNNSSRANINAPVDTKSQVATSSRPGSIESNKVRSRGFLSGGKSSISGISNLQVINSNIYVPNVKAGAKDGARGYIGVQKGANPDSPDIRKSSPLTDMFSRVNNKRMKTGSSVNGSISRGNSRDNSKFHLQDRRSSPKASDVFATHGRTLTASSIKQLANNSSGNDSICLYTDESKDIKVENSGYSGKLTKKKSKEKITGNSNLSKYATKKKKDLDVQVGNASKKTMGLTSDDADSMNEFTMLEDLTKLESEGGLRSTDTLADSPCTRTPALSSTKKVRKLKDDYEDDKEKIEKDHNIFDEPRNSISTQNNQKLDGIDDSASKLIKKGKSMDSLAVIVESKMSVRKYYRTNLLKALQKPDTEIGIQFMDHLKHTVQSMSYIEGVECPHSDDLLTSEVYLPPLARKGILSFT